ncbi:MAG TPA: hypothetical protein VKV26_19590 [Dehalococcoidia bacterium]|nr:hypothetical protein [Dehalococcoidia bacterium]
MTYLRTHLHLLLALAAGPLALFLASPHAKALADGIESWGH